jgi:hypothetical protein
MADVAETRESLPSPTDERVLKQTRGDQGDLGALVEMAQRAGGIDRLVQYLEVLKGIR